jgi:iron(III) transport system permease protein
VGRRRSGRFDSFVAVAAVPVTAMSLVVLGLLATIIALSLTPMPDSGLAGPTLRNYVDVFTDGRTYEILLNSILFGLTSLTVAFSIGLPIAWMVECSDLRGKSVVMTLMLITLLIPGFALAAGWLFLLHPRIGLINVAAVQLLGFSGPPLDLLSIVGMGWVEGLSRVPIAFLMTSVAFRSMDRSLEEAALSAGAPNAAVLGRITLPLMRPALLSAAIYILMIAFGSFDVPAIIGWSNRIFVFSTYIYLLTNPQDVFPGYGPPTALATVVLCFALLLIWWVRRMMHQTHRYAVITGKAYRPRLVRLGRWQVAAWMFIGLFLTVSLVLPLIVIVWASLLPFLQLPSARALSNLSFNHYRNLPWDLVLSGLRNTLTLALCAPPLVLTISFMFSWIGFRTRLPGRSLLDQIAFTPHAVPHIVIAMGLLLTVLYVIQPVLPIYGTIWVLVFAFAVGWLSYGTRITNGGLIQIHRELEESARISGASTWSIVGRVVMPLLSRGFLLAALYIAILTARELTLSVLLSTPGNTTLPVVIWSIWLNGGLARASAALVCFIAAVLPFMALYVVLLQRPRQRRESAVEPGSALAVGKVA